MAIPCTMLLVSAGKRGHATRSPAKGRLALELVSKERCYSIVVKYALPGAGQAALLPGGLYS